MSENTWLENRLKEIRDDLWQSHREAARAMCTPARLEVTKTRCILTRKTDRLGVYRDWLKELEERDYEYIRA